MGLVGAGTSSRTLLRVTGVLPPAPAAWWVLALPPVLHPTASLPHEKGGWLGMLQGQHGPWVEGMGASIVLPQAAKRNVHLSRASNH